MSLTHQFATSNVGDGLAVDLMKVQRANTCYRKKGSWNRRVRPQLSVADRQRRFYMRPHTLTAVAAVLAIAACNRSEPTPEVNQAAVSEDDLANTSTATENETGSIDTAFVTEAIKGDNGEVAIGKLAEAQGQSQAVKDFGKLLVSDHGAHKQKLAALAQTAGLSITDEPTDEAKANLEKLKALDGAEFDKQFKAMMVEDHQKDIAKYEKQTTSGHSETAALAHETLPTLRKHLEAANAL